MTSVRVEHEPNHCYWKVSLGQIPSWDPFEWPLRAENLLGPLDEGPIFVCNLLFVVKGELVWSRNTTVYKLLQHISTLRGLHCSHTSPPLDISATSCHSVAYPLHINGNLSLIHLNNTFLFANGKRQKTSAY